MEQSRNPLERVTQFVISEFADESSRTIAPQDDLMRQGILDSLAVLRLVNFLEQEFGVRVLDSEITVENFKNLSSIASLLEEKLRSSSV